MSRRPRSATLRHSGAQASVATRGEERMQPSVSGLRGRRQRQREAFRDEALAAAREIAASHGAGEVSMRKLAQRLGCSPMSLYSYFRDKHDLLTALAHQGFDDLAWRLAAEPAADPLAAVRAAYLTCARLAIERPDDYRMLFMTPDAHPARRGKTPDEIARQNPAFALGLDRMRACVEAGLLAGDAHAMATMLWTTTHGAVAAILTFPDFPFGEPGVYLARMVDWALDALRAAEVPPLG